VSNRNKVPCSFFSRPRIVQATKEHQRVGAVCVEPILGSKRRVRLVYCCVSPHPTKGRCRSCARNCRRSPAAVRGSAREPPSAGGSAAGGRHPENWKNPRGPQNRPRDFNRPARPPPPPPPPPPP